MWICISGMAGGGVSGMVAGTSHIITTGDGGIIAGFRIFITMWIRNGEDTTVSAIGVATTGTINAFPNESFSITGGIGIANDIGKNRKLGVSRTTNPNHNSSGRS
jgi:hypothetical protein